jgi:hypothetical protein
MRGIIMNQIYNEIIQNILTYLPEYLAAFSIFIYTAIANMPKPGVEWTKLVLYTWLYDTIQTVLPMRRDLHQLPQVPQLPQLPQLPQIPQEDVAVEQPKVTTVLPRYFK